MTLCETNNSTVVLEQEVHTWTVEILISLCKFKLIFISKYVLVEHHVIEVVDHLIQIV